MAAPVTVEDNEVIAAGRALAAEGRTVNGWSLRRALGRGDPARLLMVWQQQAHRQPSPVKEVEAGPLPPVLAEASQRARAEVGDVVGRCVAEAWQAAERLAAERAHGEAEAARAEVADLRRQLDEAHGVLAEADRRVTEAEARASAGEEAAGRLAVVEAERDAARAEAGRVREDMRRMVEAFGRAQEAEPRGRRQAAE